MRWMVWSLQQTGEGEFVGGITSREEIAWKPIGQQRPEKLCGEILVGGERGKGDKDRDRDNEREGESEGEDKDRDRKGEGDGERERRERDRDRDKRGRGRE